MTISQHCKAYNEHMKRMEEIRKMLADQQKEHDAGDEDSRAWPIQDKPSA